jgi:hypothetical protein
VPEDLDAGEKSGNLLDDGLSDIPGRKRIAELPMLASLYLQAIGPMGTTGPARPASSCVTQTWHRISSPIDTS